MNPEQSRRGMETSGATRPIGRTSDQRAPDRQQADPKAQSDPYRASEPAAAVAKVAAVATAPAALPAFSARGIELEMMIVERDTLEPLPIADHILRTEAGQPTSDVMRGLLGWSNELVLHVIEVKNLDPATPLEQLAPAFQREVRYLNHILEHFNACLMPTAMHPWMDPASQTRIWPHQNAALYATYASIFNCRTHGWANLQSMHVNLPFAGDAEFARLHAAIRLVLPLLPALAASSPLVDGGMAGPMDYRMQAYAGNAAQYPPISGQIVPESVDSCAQYQQQILAPMYRAIAPADPAGMLQQEWLNSRGAIARFDRSAIEIRVLDTQECALANLALAHGVIGMVRHLYLNGPPLVQQQALPTASLATLLQSCVRDADQALIENEEYLSLLGYTGSSCSSAELLASLIAQADAAGLLGQGLPTAQLTGSAQAGPASLRATLYELLRHGPLARRILRALDGDTSRERMHAVYQQLCVCLQRGQLFVPG